MIDDLIVAAERRGYRVRWHHRGPKAAWIPDQRAISLRHGMTDTATLCALAHELGHAHHDDPPGHHPAFEARADRFAARILIDPDDYRLVENLYGPHPARLAHELGVTVNVLKTWQTIHERRKAS